MHMKVTADSAKLYRTPHKKRLKKKGTQLASKRAASPFYVVIPNLAKSRAESKLALVAKLALRKAVNSRPQSVDVLAALLAD